MSASLEEILAYQLGELDPEAELAFEERLFTDPELASRADAVARLGDAVHALARAGRFGAALTVEAVEELRRQGVRIRSYTVEAGSSAPCSVEREDLVVVRLRGGFRCELADVTSAYEPEGAPAFVERLSGVPVDLARGEIVLVSPGERIRALPRTRVNIRVDVGGGEPPVEFGLDHTP